MRCLTITLNAALDTTYWVERFVPGATQRVARQRTMPGGKGNNVARVLAAQGHAVVASGFVAGRAGGAIERGLRDLGIAAAFARVPGESRTCLTVIETVSGRVSELLERGVAIGPAAARRFLRRAAGLARGADAVVVSGSLPAGLPPDYYAELLRALRPATPLLAFDSSGEALRLGLAAGPDLVKPNGAEIASLIGPTGDLGELVARARARLIGPGRGPERLLVSLGAGGAVLIAADRAFHAPAPAGPLVNPVGAGDALLAGFVGAIGAGEHERSALAWAVACGTAAAGEEVAGVADPALAARLRAAIAVAPVADPVPAAARG